MSGVIAPRVAALEQRWAGSPALLSLYALPYRRLVRRELALAGMGPGARILHIGCGSLPFTAILAARLGGEVTAIDRDPASVAGARRALAGLEAPDPAARRVCVLQADAACDTLPPADVVLVALQAAPKRGVLANLLGQLPGARAVFRLPRPALEPEYGTLDAPEGPVAACRHALMPTFDRSELYVLA